MFRSDNEEINRLVKWIEQNYKKKSGSNVTQNETDVAGRMERELFLRRKDEYYQLATNWDGLHTMNFDHMYAELWSINNSTDITFNSGSGYVQITVFDNEGNSKGLVPDTGESHISVPRSGYYFVAVSISISNQAGAAHAMDVDLKKNNGASDYDNVHASRYLGAGTDVGSVSMSGIIYSKKGDTLEIWANTDRGSDTDVRFEDINFSVIGV